MMAARRSQTFYHDGFAYHFLKILDASRENRDLLTMHVIHCIIFS
ncbi:hypothetical protein [Thermotalea metallivorans]|nr:hypothetical protein [Thermotalea metallivorans]